MVVRKGATEFKYTQKFLDSLFGDDLHAKRVHSLANATLGAMTSASLAVCTIGHGLALARGGLSKHAIKQVDRLLSNPGIDVKDLFMSDVHGGLTEKRRNRHGLDGLRCR
jgi:NAD/NADP transhydrogenase beta subunit